MRQIAVICLAICVLVAGEQHRSELIASQFATRLRKRIQRAASHEKLRCTSKDIAHMTQSAKPNTVFSTAPTSTSANDEGIPMSVVIRDRIQSAKKRFHANDNISAYMQDGELQVLQDEVASKMKEVLKSLVIDTDNDHNTNETAKRVAKMFVREVFAGRYAAEPAITEFPNVTHLNELMIVGPITVRSACSHHFCPIIGRVWVGVMPNEHSNLIGLSKYNRLIDWIMSRPQIQEEAVKQVGDLLQDKIQPDGLAIVMEADHFCMHWRGVKDMDSKMVNSVMRGSFLKDANLRREFLSLINTK
jgi:GTP cyclohydrolase IA